MARKSATDWDTCKNCHHTINIHTLLSVVGECRAYKCTCEKYKQD